MIIETATVVSNKLVNDKFTEGQKCRVLNVRTNTNNQQESIWYKQPTSFAFLEPGIKIQVVRDDKGKLSILEGNPPRNIGGDGLKPIGDTLVGNNIQEAMQTNSAAYQVYSNGQPDSTNLRVATQESTITNGHSQIENIENNTQEGGLSLPILSDREKIQLKQYVAQQVNMFYYLTQEVTKNMSHAHSNNLRPYVNTQGERNGFSKLSQIEATEIKRLSRQDLLSLKEIACLFNILYHYSQRY